MQAFGAHLLDVDVAGDSWRGRFWQVFAKDLMLSTLPLRGVGLCQSFVLFDPNIFHIFRAPDAQIVQVFRAEMVRLAACLGDSVAVEAFIRLGLGREDRVLVFIMVFRCDFATPPTPPVRMVSF